ncbi:hypothetical protein DPMN_093996 [Dreissena polymorpha]|uniref:Uncharacterized protein n=1 Tax=Dreissena polymorpha TaxID=45954 RepID=A0A9D4L557_DREPO|nr:hypothetical protein DPMN_093996 [Dreissena polymorpha]
MKENAVRVWSLDCSHIWIDARKETSMECAADVDITFNLYSNMLNKSLTIAECVSLTKSCFILTKTHEHKYKIVYTGRGGILILRVLDESTIGSYQCFETSNPINIVSTNITLSEYRIPAENYSDSSAETSVPVHIDTHGHIVIGTLKDTSIECSSNVDLTFRFFRNTSKMHATIGECDFTIKSCIILKKSLANTYNLYFTGRGGILQISRIDNETVGTYTCSETFNPLNFVSVDISIPSIDSADYTTYGITTVTGNTPVTYLDGSGTQDSPISLIIVLCIMLTLCALTISCIICWWILIKKIYPFWSASRGTIERSAVKAVQSVHLRNVNECEEPLHHDIRAEETGPLLVDSETAHGVVKVFRRWTRIKLSDAEHKDCYAAINQLLSDLPYLMQDDKNLAQMLEKDTLNITKEMFHLLEAVDEILNNKLKDVADTSVTEMSESTQDCMKKIKEYLDTCTHDIVNPAGTHKRDIDERADVHKHEIDENNDSPIRNIGVQADTHTTRKDDRARKRMVHTKERIEDSSWADKDYKRALEDCDGFTTSDIPIYVVLRKKVPTSLELDDFDKSFRRRSWG